MKKYENLDNFRLRQHTLEITLQSGEYKGSFKQSMGGNCFGLDILKFFDPDEIYDDELIENNCELKISEADDGEYWFSCVLKDDEGNECEVEDELRDLKRLVVKLEIVECEIVERR